MSQAALPHSPTLSNVPCKGSLPGLPEILLPGNARDWTGTNSQAWTPTTGPSLNLLICMDVFIDPSWNSWNHSGNCYLSLSYREMLVSVISKPTGLFLREKCDKSNKTETAPSPEFSFWREIGFLEVNIKRRSSNFQLLRFVNFPLEVLFKPCWGYNVST